MLRHCSLLLLLASALSAAVTVPAEVATVLSSAQDAATPEQALAALAAYRGQPHALIDLAIAQAHHRLLRSGPEDQRDAHRRAATQAYSAALERDSGLRPARWGLAQLAADLEDWANASRWASEALDANQANASEWQFAAHATLRAGDRRLAAALISTALMRFPGDQPLRRLDLALLIEGDRYAEARLAVLDLLDRAPGDRDLWQHLAHLAQATGREDEALAAIEAALGCDAGNRVLRRSLADRFLARGWPQAALPHYTALMDEPQSSADALLVELAARCAAEARELTQARAWIAAVPEQQRSRGQHLLAARLAVEQGDAPAAATALDALVALGEADPRVLAWAGELAESRGEETRAAAFYGQAMAGDGPGADAARLRLAALRLRQGLLEEAATLIDTYLQRHPDDASARRLRLLVEQRRPVP